MSEDIKVILDKLFNRKQETLIQGLRECQLKDIEHPFITKEEYIDKILNYITNLQQEIDRLKNIINKIESIVYADISNIDARIFVQDVLDEQKKQD